MQPVSRSLLLLYLCFLEYILYVIAHPEPFLLSHVPMLPLCSHDHLNLLVLLLRLMMFNILSLTILIFCWNLAMGLPLDLVFLVVATPTMT